MDVNTQIYGAYTTWTRDDGFNYAAVPDAYAFKKGQYDTLKDYVNANKLTIGEPIDYSICYAGMASDLPLSKLKTWVVLEDGDDYLIQMYSRNEPTGWFFGHGKNFASTYAEIYGSPILLDNRPDALYRIADYYWIPNGQLTETTLQVSQNITPIVEFNPHACYFGINVEVFNRQTGDFSTYYLDEMRSHTFTAYEVITRAWGELWTRRGDTDTDYSAAGTYCGVCPDRLIDFGSNSIPYLSYAYNLSHHFPLFGWLDTRPDKILLSGDTLYTVYKRPFYSPLNDGVASTSQYFVDTLNDTVYNTTDTEQYNYIVECYAPITAANLEKLRQCAAAYGLFFTEKNPHDLYNNANRWTSSDMFLGVLTDGVGHGEYTRGNDNRNNPVFDLSSSQQSTYKPSAPIDDNTYDNITSFRDNINLYTGVKQYALTAVSVQPLADKLYDIIGDWSGVTYAEIMGKVASDFLVQNPMDCIVSLYCFPFGVNLGNSTTVKLGKYDTNIPAYELTSKTIMIDFAGKRISPRFGDSFLDYEPYTRYEVYVPFCGTVKLNAADILGHQLNVRLSVDLFTGVCTGYILADRLCIETVTGTCGVQVPMTGLDTATINANIVSANIKYRSAVSSETNAIMSPLTIGGFGQAILNPVSMTDKVNQAQLAIEQTKYDLHHIEAKPHQIGAASPLTGWCMDTNARIMIYYPTGDAVTNDRPPKLKDLTTYGHTTGFATIDNKQLSNYTGFTVATNAVLNFSATATEKSMINDLLQNGVYL